MRCRRNEKKREEFKKEMYLVYRGYDIRAAGAGNHYHYVDGRKSVIHHR